MSQLSFDMRPPVLRVHLGDEIVADNFAGGGGASSGLAAALGRSPDIAVNHDPEAIAMHRANHPDTEHYLTSVYEVDPVVACGGKPVALAWFSPDCKHHSKAKGGKPRAQKIRGLAWVAVRWASKVRPRVIALENVEEFKDWGPLYRDHTDGCDGQVRERRIKGRTRETVGCRKGCRHGKPIVERKGETFNAFRSKLERLGYVVEWRLLRASDYGAPTSRRRLFLIARCDGRPIVWPVPSHGPGRAKPHRTAAEIIDWSIPCPSIFDRKKPLADATMARIARGVQKFVIEAARPFLVPYYGERRDGETSRARGVDEPVSTITTANRFGLVTPYIVPVNHGGEGRDDRRVHSVEEPLRTVTSHGRGSHAVITPLVVSMRGTDPSHLDASARPADEPLRTISAGGTHHALAIPYLVHRSNGERPGQAPRIYDPQRPIGTIVAQGQKHAICTAFLARHYGDRATGGWAGGASLERPIPTVTTRDHHALVAALLVRYNGTGEAEPVERPLGTLTTKDRYGLVTVIIDGEEYAIVDIGMRMLTPTELFAAQGFPPDYQISPLYKGKPLTKTAQVKMCGNSVCPPIAEAIALSQLATWNEPYRMAA